MPVAAQQIHASTMPSPDDDVPEDENDEAPLTQTSVLALVWSKDRNKEMLGAAWVESSSSVLRFCEAVDTSPEFRSMQSLKFSLNPSLIVTPSTSDQAYLERLASACSSVGAGRAHEANDEQDELAPRDPNGFMVTLCKGKDFSADMATKRLSLLRNLGDIPDRELTERERQLHLEHILPPDHTLARRAVGGLLAHLQRADASASMTITRLERYRIDKLLFMSPDTFVSLGSTCQATHPPLDPWRHAPRLMRAYCVLGTQLEAKT